LLVGDPELDIEIAKTSIWYVNQAYATSYSKGRVLCGGDATHRHPPSSGLGLNTCVQDGFNLAWKLAYVLRGHAKEKLLASYSDERAPVGKQIVMRANQSRLDYAPLKAVFRVEGADNPVAAGIARFKDAGPEGVKARLAAQEALALKDREFNAQGVELNQRYASAAVVPDLSAGPEEWSVDQELHLQPTTRPGAKLPHAWLIDRKGNRISTLDTVGKGKFTLITGQAGMAWAEAAAGLKLDFMRVVVTGLPGHQDPYCAWQKVREIPEAGALLVRPDGYVAWRETADVFDKATATERLQSALSKVLGLD
jgi:2,4-dichlorophenol 6-monooxygenase